MKDKLINLKEKMIIALKNLKEKTVELYTSNKKIFIICTAILLILIILIIAISSKTKIGNTSTNLNNFGFSVQKGGKVYFLGLKRNNTDGIYSVSKNGNKIKKISSDYGIYLNAIGKYIYFLDLSSNEYNIARMKTDGSDKETIIKDVDSKKVTVINNWIYYFKDSNFYKSKVSGDNKQILSKKAISNYEIIGNIIYYSYADDGKTVISKMKTNGEKNEKIDTDASEKFFISNGKIYYIYENYDENKFEYKYELYKINTNGKNKDLITEVSKNIKFDSINFDGNRIYYAREDENNKYSIYNMKLNGKSEKKIIDLEGTSTIINMHDGWMYYTDQKDNGDSQMYKVKTNGKDRIEL